MFDNPLNQDTVYEYGLSEEGWWPLSRICECVNEAGYAITMKQTERLLHSLVERGKLEMDDSMLPTLWRKAAKPRGGEVVK